MKTKTETIAQEPNITAMEQKANEIRKEHYNTIVLFEVGDYYESYGNSAVDLARLTGLTLTYKDDTRCAAIPSKKKDTYYPVIVRKGYKICIYTKGTF